MDITKAGIVFEWHNIIVLGVLFVGFGLFAWITYELDKKEHPWKY